MAENLVVNGVQYNGVESISMTNDIGEQVVFHNIPELDNPGEAKNLLKDNQLIDQEGNVVQGTMPNNGNISATIDGLTTTSATIPAGYTSGGAVSLTSDIENALAAI